MEIKADDEKGRQTLAQYIIKAPISQERMILYDKENQKVIYKSKHGTIIYEPLDWCYPQAHSPPVNDETRIVEEATHDYSLFDYLPA